MAHYSIKDLEQLSGIKAHTIRIWEQRYGLLNPERTATNIRLYSDEDLKTLMNVSCLNSMGIKISKIAELPREQIHARVLASRSQKKSEYASTINHMIVLMIELDESSFKNILRKSFESVGVIDTFKNLVYPFMNKIGVLWQIGTINPAQEHFISHIIRNQIVVETEALEPTYTSRKKAVLFLPENERHEIGLLLHNYILRSKGYKTLYLGVDVPYHDLKLILGNVKPNITLCAFINPIEQKELNHFVSKIGKDFPNITHYFAGHQSIEKITINKRNLIVLKEIQDIMALK